MASQFELYNQMALILDRLIENAKKMKEGIRLKVSQEELEGLQNKQHEILHEVSELDNVLQKSPLGASEDEINMCKARIREKLAHFQVINKEFFDSISSHSRVIDTKDK